MGNYSPTGSSHPIGDVTGNTPTNATVTTSSTQISAANGDRRFIILSNIGNKDVFLASGQTAILNSGAILLRGESIVIGAEAEPLKEAINGIVSAGTTTIAVLEFE